MGLLVFFSHRGFDTAPYCSIEGQASQEWNGVNKCRYTMEQGPFLLLIIVSWQAHPSAIKHGNGKSLSYRWVYRQNLYQLGISQLAMFDSRRVNLGIFFWWFPLGIIILYLTCAKRREFSGMIHWPTMNNHPSNPQQPIHSLSTSKISFDWVGARKVSFSFRRGAPLIHILTCRAWTVELTPKKT